MPVRRILDALLALVVLVVGSTLSLTCDVRDHANESRIKALADGKWISGGADGRPYTGP